MPAIKNKHTKILKTLEALVEEVHAKVVAKLGFEVGYFGGCPKCGDSMRQLNVCKQNWLVCDKHKKCWLVGENLFSSWRHENESIWKENLRTIQSYEEVESLPPTNPNDYADAEYFLKAMEEVLGESLCAETRWDKKSQTGSAI